MESYNRHGDIKWRQTLKWEARDIAEGVRRSSEREGGKENNTVGVRRWREGGREGRDIAVGRSGINYGGLP